MVLWPLNTDFWHMVRTFSPFDETAAINNALKHLEVVVSLLKPQQAAKVNPPEY